MTIEDCEVTEIALANALDDAMDTQSFEQESCLFGIQVTQVNTEAAVGEAADGVLATDKARNKEAYSSSRRLKPW